MLKPLPNHRALRLHNDDDNDESNIDIASITWHHLVC